MTAASPNRSLFPRGPCFWAKPFFAIVALFSMVAMAQDGSPDPSWGNGGRLMIGVSGGADFGYRLLPQQHGRMLLVGNCQPPGGPSNAFCATRLRRDGSYDLGFGPGGLGYASYETLFGILRASALQSDGKIVLAGGTYFLPDRAMVARLGPTGLLDKGVGGGQGFLQFDFYVPAVGDAVGWIQAMAVQSDGKILVAGTAQVRRGGISNYDFAIARLMPDLAGFDPTFGGGDGLSPPGVKLVPFDLLGPGSTEVHDIATAMAVRADGRIWVAGIAANNTDFSRPAVVRLLDNGQLDTSFGDSGRWVLADAIDGGRYTISSALIDRSGGLLIAGSVSATGAAGNWDFLLVRLLNDAGAASWHSVAFDIGGNFQDFAHAVVEQSDGRILLAGQAQTTSDDFRYALSRLHADGTIDLSFGIDGRSTGSFSANDAGQHAGYALALGNGGLMVVGRGRPTSDANDTRFGIAKLRLDLVFTDGFQR